MPEEPILQRIKRAASHPRPHMELVVVGRVKDARQHVADGPEAPRATAGDHGGDSAWQNERGRMQVE